MAGKVGWACSLSCGLTPPTPRSAPGEGWWSGSVGDRRLPRYSLATAKVIRWAQQVGLAPHTLPCVRTQVRLGGADRRD
eukprot:8655956-Alexandrium_andersonii.AAC.1